MDEVYVASKVEYTCGKYFGCENGTPTKTLLGTMLKSVAGHYKDIVSLTPLTRIDYKIIAEVFTALLETAVKIGCDITVSLLDGHSSNCKCYKELCSGMINLSIVNPLKAGYRILLLFDPVHVFKNFYNNLLNKLYFECPNFEDKFLKPNLQHIKDMYNAELGKSVKIAYRLSDKVLNPATIERSNVSLADLQFHESTIAALNLHAVEKACPEYTETTNFSELIRRWWNLLNSKSTLTGQAKRDCNRESLESKNLDRLDFLASFSSWLEDWENSNSRGLSRETFFCAKQTSSAMPSLIKYLLT